MLQNYLKIALRNFFNNKTFTSLSVMSLTIAMACVLLIGLFVRHELSYDRFHEKADRIYRLTTRSVNQQTERAIGFVPLPLAAALTEEFPSVAGFTRVWEYRRSMPVSNPEQDLVFYEENFGWADESFFDLFDFEIVAGEQNTPLREFRSVVISESAARKYFGEENPVGKQLYFRGEVDIPMQVSAVMADFPANSHFTFDFVADIRVAAEDFWAGGGAGQQMFDEWLNLFVPAYILMEPGADPAPVLAEAEQRINEHLGGTGATYEVAAQPLTSIHLGSRLDVGEWEVNGSMSNIYALSGIGLIVMVLGCFNFINLVTARAGQRVREVGLRKTLGGTSRQLIEQHFMEILILVFSAAALAFVTVELVLPRMDGFSRIGTGIDLLLQPEVLLGWALLVLVILLLSAAWPAWFISRFHAADALKGTYTATPGGVGLRKVLVSLQFALSGALIVCTIVVYQQLQFMQQTELGFSEEQIVVVPIHRDGAIIPNFNRVKEIWEQHADVVAATSSSHLMQAEFTYTNTFQLTGSDISHSWERYTVEADYPEVYELELIAGRSFLADAATDSNAVILNHRAVEEMGLAPEDAVGETLQNLSMGSEGLIVGVVEDFHYQSMHESIQPFVLIHRPEQVDYISVKIAGRDIRSTIEFLEAAWNRAIPDASFGYYFLDDTFDALYAREEQLSRFILGFSGVAIFLACMGLFGLSLFTVERRTKEIGVRKVLGASVTDIVLLLGSDYTRLILWALVPALPAAWLLMDGWLSNFAYRIELSAWIFAVGFLFVVGISWLTVSWNSIRAGTANPVHSLKSD